MTTVDDDAAQARPMTLAQLQRLAQMASPPERVCWACGERGPLKRCPRCGASTVIDNTLHA